MEKKWQKSMHPLLRRNLLYLISFCLSINWMPSPVRCLTAETAAAPTSVRSADSKTGAKIVWQFDFRRSPLSLRRPSYPNVGVWMPNDETWQNGNQGYEDFAASTCSNADVASKLCNMAGGTFNINPNDPKTTKFNPFSSTRSGLLISAIRTPRSMYSAIQTELIEQGVSGPVPSFLGGRLTTNPNLFPGFTYGYFEFCVAFLNSGPGMFPALWFYSTPGAASNPGKRHAEIDLLEFFGYSDEFHTTTIQGNSGNASAPSIHEQAGKWRGLIDGKFHEYGMDWTENSIDFYVDHKFVYSASREAVLWFRGVSLAPVINYAVDAPWMTSNAGLQANSKTPNRLRMIVRYVRLYKRKPFGNL